MSSEKRLRLRIVLAALCCAVVDCAKEGDFDFGLAQDFVVNIDAGAATGAGMWGSREATATVGKVFHLVVPREAFDENVNGFEAKKFGGKPLPSWLLFDKKSATFWGVPLQEDHGPFQVMVKSLPKEQSSTYQLTIDVIENNIQEESTKRCAQSEDITILTLLLDKNARIIKPKQRVVAIDNIARFFGLPFSAFSLKPQTTPDDITDSSVVLAGPGNVRIRSSKYTSFLQVPVGCDGRLWDSTTPMVHQLKQQARDGTITEVLRLPLIGWRVKTETRPAVRSKRQTLEDGSGDYEDYYDDYEDDDYDGEDTDISSSSSASSSSTSTSTTTTTTSTTTTTEVPVTHPHRHHHGQSIKPIDPSVPVIHEHHNHEKPRHFTEERIPITIPPTSTTTTTTTEPPQELTTSNNLEIPKPSGGPADYDYEYYDKDDDEGGDDDGPEESQTVVPSFSSKTKQKPFEEIDNANNWDLLTEPFTTVKTTVKDITIPEDVPVTRILETTVPEEQTTQAVVEDFAPPIETVPPTTTTTTTTTEAATTPQLTTISTTTTTTTTPIPITIPPTITTTKQETTTTQTEPPTTTTTSTTSTTTTTESPTTTHQQTTTKQVTESPKSTTTIREVTETIEIEEKNFKPYIENRLQQMSVFAGKIFRYVVPVNTFKDFEDEYNLSLEFFDSNEQPVGRGSWCQFNRARREIYGLPLEKDVSKWTYYVRATDSEGSYVQDTLTIQVQQHKMARVINHEYTLQIRIEKPQEFPHYIDWSLKTLRALGKIYNSNMSEITVKQIVSNEEPVVFSWWNDTIPTNYCPRVDITNVYKTLTANDRGDPSRELSMALSPELRVKKASYNFIGVCEQPVNPATPRDNFSPILRNPVDHVNATIGELLIYKVRDDTFYDPEDVDPRTLNISLLTATRQAISANSWLQFDNKNREFFGIPRKSGRTEYQLVCEDSGGLSVTDSLEVVVYSAPKVHYNVEFSMALETRFESFANSASKQKKFVEKLMEIFHEPNSSNIHFAPFKQNADSTIVTWFNKSLSREKCPTSEINRLESLMINKHDMESHGISHRLLNIMGEEFIVSTIKINMMGNCNVKLPSPPEVIPIDETTPQSTTDEYLITFIIPIVIISVMLFVAAVAACVLYRRRRMGKMNVEEDGRANYGNKGIPVIFQEELEEKPEPGTKAPVILKDEKPPLAPPEYSKSGSVKLNDDSEPYQPPPPFTRTQDNGRQSRPKPTPTYRKPPPYVPP
ncbi:unnamed protein product [Brassicogethes aeneus]|uniref:Dystroglycan 1 n=1 Tax=Brassicogethes aeneus TaxID=1431903 RepID=A0A9P0FFP8_BRAAE|nr:unnamed protein product [Brassicogethes aeneus]